MRLWSATPIVAIVIPPSLPAGIRGANPQGSDGLLPADALEASADVLTAVPAHESSHSQASVSNIADCPYLLSLLEDMMSRAIRMELLRSTA
jgi:hypothetical protein